tara:strand:+ start:3866 stop:4399 length:534 start_codon:yes stop_codon:yes gene_type:complete
VIKKKWYGEIEFGRVISMASNRNHMFESGEFVSKNVEPIADVQIQPNGVDLTLCCVFIQTGKGRIEKGGKEIGDREEVEAKNGKYKLKPGGYIIRYFETVSIPEGNVGFIYPRSSMLRNSCMVNTAVWDSGYKGKGESFLQVYREIEIEKGARVAQIIFARGENSGVYAGGYQGENL